MSVLLSLLAVEPVIALATVLALALGALGLAVDVSTVTNLLMAVLPFLPAAIARVLVTPNAKVKS